MNETNVPSQAPVQGQVVTNSQSGTSGDTKTLVTILLLIFIFPVGWIVMWFYPKWPVWVKLLVSLPTIVGGILLSLFIYGIGAGMTSSLTNTSDISLKARCASICSEVTSNNANCVKQCIDTKEGTVPSNNIDTTDTTE